MTTTAQTAPQLRPFRAAWQAALAQATIRNHHQRALVLRHPAIARRLCEPPLRLDAPAQWTGYIPGYWEAEDRHGRVRPNTSPVRAQLAQILQDAAEAADGEAAKRADTAAAKDDSDEKQTTDQITPPWRKP